MYRVKEITANGQAYCIVLTKPVALILRQPVFWLA